MKPSSSFGPAGPSRRRGSRIPLRRRLLLGFVHSAVVTFIVYFSLHSALHGIARAVVIIGLIACDGVIAWAFGRSRRNRNPQG